MTISISSLLTAGIASGAQNQGQLRIAAIGNLLTNRLNAKITELKNTSTDPAFTNFLNSQISALSKQNDSYSAALPILGKNAQVVSDIKIQLGTLAFSA